MFIPKIRDCPTNGEMFQQKLSTGISKFTLLIKINTGPGGLFATSSAESVILPEKRRYLPAGAQEFQSKKLNETGTTIETLFIGG